MWKPLRIPQKLMLPEGVPDGVFGAWLPTRKCSPTDPVPEINNLHFVDAVEASRFATAKRAEEHAAARYLISHLLESTNRNPADYKIVRDGYRRPYLIGPDSPALSITHSGGIAAVVIGPDGLDIGLDLEPLTTRPRNLLPLMASGDERAELESLWDIDEQQAIHLTTDVWVAKEAVQKAAGLGMGLAPQSFAVIGSSNVTVGRRNFDILSWKSTILNAQIQFALAVAK